jgi:hypothetical protein
VQVEHPSGDIVTYAFNGDGLCVRQDDGVVELETLYDGLNRVLEEDGGTIEADYTATPEPYGNALSQHRSGDSSFYLWDGIRNVRQLTDGAEVVTDSYGFDGWGRSTGVTVQHRHMGFGPNHCHAEAVREPFSAGRRSMIGTWRRSAGVLLFRVGKAPLCSGQAGAVDGVPSLFRAVRSHELRMTEFPNIGTQRVVIGGARQKLIQCILQISPDIQIVSQRRAD